MRCNIDTPDGIRILKVQTGINYKAWDRTPHPFSLHSQRSNFMRSGFFSSASALAVWKGSTHIVAIHKESLPITPFQSEPLLYSAI